LGEIKVVRDFLPFPTELAFSEESVKVTISLRGKHEGVRATHLTRAIK
jgi:hypothetical protein